MSLQPAIGASLLKILNHVPGLVWSTDTELRLNFICGCGLQKLGLSSEQAQGIRLCEFLGTWDDQFPAIVAHRKALSGKTADCTLDYCGCLLRLKVEPHRDDEGIPIGCFTFAEDVTDLTVSEMQTRHTRCLQDAIGKIHRAFEDLQPIEEQLHHCLDILLSIPWLSLQSCGAIFLLEPDQNVLALVAQRNLAESLLSACAHVPVGHCLCGRAASSREVVHADGLDDRHEIRYEGIHEHGHYCVPMIADRELVGVLNLYVNPEHRKDSQEEQFLSIVATVLASAIKSRQTAEKLRQSEERFFLAVRGTDAGIWDWDLSTSEVYFSPRWKGMLGYSDDEIGGDFSEWEDRIHPRDVERAQRTLRNYLEGHQDRWELEHRLRHKDGSYRCMLARGAVVRDRIGQACRMVGSHLDITERKRLEWAMREQRAQLLAAGEIQSFMLPEAAPEVPGFCGHPPAIIINRHGQPVPLPEDGGLPLGIDRHAEYVRAGPIQLEAGDILVLVTDGILEAIAEKYQQFGTEGLVAAVRSNQDCPAACLVERLHHAALDFSGSRKFDDDVTILVVKVL